MLKRSDVFSYLGFFTDLSYCGAAIFCRHGNDTGNNQLFILMTNSGDQVGTNNQFVSFDMFVTVFGLTPESNQFPEVTNISKI
jgi:hypothetical protein